MALLTEALTTGGYSPTFPAMLNVTVPAHMTKAEYAAHIGIYLKELRTALRRQTNWLAKCDAYSAGTGPAPKVSTMPSKASKHRLYSASGHMNTLCGWQNIGQTARCGSIGDIGRQIAAVEAALKAF